MTSMDRSGTYAGCAWLALAALLSGGAYWGLGIAGPSAIPAVLLLLAAAACSVGLAGALWTGFGGRKVAILSLTLGLSWAALYLVRSLSEYRAITAEAIGAALVGVAISLASAFAIGGKRR